MGRLARRRVRGRHGQGSDPPRSRRHRLAAGAGSDGGGNYGSGNGLDTGWVLGYLLLTLAAMWALTNPDLATGNNDYRRPMEHP